MSAPSSSMSQVAAALNEPRLSTSGSSGSLPSLDSDGDSSAARSSVASLLAHMPMRKNEHLAVLLPRDLWKPDSQAAYCDAFTCRAPFTLRERRHHCRKCGGIFCASCSARTTPLLDTSNLAFLHPPKGTPLAMYASERAPLLPHRVCDACHDQIHGIPARPYPVPDAVVTPASPGFELDSASASGSEGGLAAPMSRTSSLRARPRNGTWSRSASTVSSRSHSPATPPASAELGALAAYPLWQPSLLCKATGGGRWVPSPDPIDPALRSVPGGKAPYELALEAEEAAERNRWDSPIIRDGEFMMRKPVDRGAAARSS
ncbi:unnamed protein product [Peniophora sp. CBMAI 1063]|nr:unnamed protein product [Peniophora sp. CBMAI 1063]